MKIVVRNSVYAVLGLSLIISFRAAAKKPLISKQGYSEVNGIKMYYEIYGQGKPLVLIHGGGSTIQTTFGQVIPMLAKKYKVIAMDLQAHGRTSDRAAPESFE